MSDRVGIDVQRHGRWIYTLMIKVRPRGSDEWLLMEYRPASIVVGKRWARWKARRMLRRALRGST